MKRHPPRRLVLPDPVRLPCAFVAAGEESVDSRRATVAARSPGRARGGPSRRELLRVLGCTFVAPLPALRSLIDPLRAVPSVIANLTPLQLIGWHRPRLRRGRWNDAELLREATGSLDEMSSAARADGVDLWARSGHRTFSQQRYLWNSKCRGRTAVRTADGGRGTLDRDMPVEEKVRRILTFTAFPGTSRHHWGTDVDMAQLFSDRCGDYLLEQLPGSEGEEGRREGAEGEEAEEGQERAEGRIGAEAPRTGRDCTEGEGEGGVGGTREDAEVPENCLPSYRWLLDHAADYGWCRVYDVPRGGFLPEPWHWSYLPLAVPALARYLAEVTAGMLRDRDVDGDSVILDDFESYRDRFLLGIAAAALPAADQAAPQGEPPAGDDPGEALVVPELP